MKRSQTNIAKIIIVIIVFIAGTENGFSQLLSKKDESLFKKAEKQYSMGKFDEADKKYNQILLNVEHGRSLKRIGDIESLIRNNSEAALSNYSRALILLKEDLARLQSTGDLESINEAEEWIGSCEKGISISGGKKEEFVVETSQKTDNAQLFDSNSSPEIKSMKSEVIIESDGIALPELNKKVKFYENATVTSFFAYSENPLPKTMLPSVDELTKILTEILQSDVKSEILSGLDWGESENLVFITSETFFDEMNDHKCKALSITKDSLVPELIAIDLGEMASVILIEP
jgi:hypothetical protein